METNKKIYLGDGVYVEDDGYNGVILTTENGIETTNTIYLEREVLDNFLSAVFAQGDDLPR